jgi:hypothetical protein
MLLLMGSNSPKEYDFLLSNHPALDEYLEKFFRWFLINILYNPALDDYLETSRIFG